MRRRGKKGAGCGLERAVGPEGKAVGRRRGRRLEHARLLAGLAAEGEIVEDLSDLLPDYGSAFATLLTEAQAMQVPFLRWQA